MILETIPKMAINISMLIGVLVLTIALILPVTFARPSGNDVKLEHLKQQLLNKKAFHHQNSFRKNELQLLEDMIRNLKRNSEQNTVDDEEEKEIESQFIFTGDGTNVRKVKDTIKRKNNFNFERRPPQNTKRGFDKAGITWTNGIIPYEISNDFSVSEKQQLINWANALTQKLSTCIELRPATSSDKNRISITGKSTGCWSYVGFTGDAVQELNLDKNGCVYQNVFDHEFGHAIGLFHEQSRSDRDKYLQMHMENVDPSMKYNYDKENTINLHPYDLSSIMHYSKDAFVTDYSKDAFSVKDKQLEFLLDSGDVIQYYDIRDVVTRYKCAEKCTNPPACKFGSFLDGTCKCRCPEGLKGDLCDQPVAHDQSKCGDFLIDVSDGSSKTIQSANYPNKMPSGYTCTYVVKGAKGESITAEIENLSLAASSKCEHSLEIRYNRMGQRGPEFCGQDKEPKLFTSTKDETPELIFLRLKAVETTVSSNGFKIIVKNLNGQISTQKPASDKPTTEVQTTENPATNQPVTEKPKPSTENPVTEKPKPSTENPVTEKPKPSTENPVTEKPAGSSIPSSPQPYTDNLTPLYPSPTPGLQYRSEVVRRKQLRKTLKRLLQSLLNKQ